ncbi:MAG: hypothetical protein MK198_02870 [Gracilimonas sp.]|jgi:hypothetical protein|uniref:hypothetical protein n=1 Tax=Gracilimonas sp. TaxID=1974203 RepID=UPI003750E602|nr:hypothetical protein [Gracilimonas sp.]
MSSNALSITPKQNKETTLFAVPVLKRIQQESIEEYNEMQQAFNLMGWGGIPDKLKIEIHEDVKYMVEELKGRYSSCDPFVKRRRNSIHYWVSCYQDGICSLEAAIKALKIKAL